MPTSTPITHPILNPNIYLNYLPPRTAKQFEVARDLYLATLGALLWDMLVSLPEDLMLFKSGFRLTLLAYLLSRFSALGYVLLSVIAKTHTVSHCTALELGVTICWVMATAASSFLFFQRVKAVYSGQKIVHYVFFALLLTNIGMSTLVPIGSHVGPLANTGYCVNTGLKHYTAGSAFSRLVFDSFVFLAISFRVATMRGVSGESLSWKTLLSRNASSRLVRAILRGGQQYYLMSVCSNILVSVLIVTPSVPPIYQAMFTVPDIALSSSMACRVFRNLKITADRVDTAMSGVLFRKSAPLGGGESGATTTRLQSDASTLHLPPPETRTRLTSTATRSLHTDERYSIIKLKPFPSANAASMATEQSTTTGPPV
ncbi:hypothetical protein GALMADRAFT_157818 [Galerina marginata CBS 339.88]|uniref:G-protein coupled receptors family 1 profile domain-containing protein n=1 Tax=Galerina marginata (strain CBS 339.88) TaxID=685588 RepID=A0A067SSW4_GALM3|nr:hypothetical protein GALMADRAFT_157818 [Galerina marginata CBS 339.88]